MSVFDFAGHRLDLRLGRLTRQGRDVSLRPKSLALLTYFMQNPDRVIGRDELIGAVWPDVVVSDDSLTQCLKDIRVTLGSEGDGLIRTVPRRGYMLDGARLGRREAEPAGTPRGRLPIIAVLPIESENRENRWLRFADGLSADIIVELARHSEFSTIAFHTMKTLQTRGDALFGPDRALGADYVLQGWLHADDRRLRLAVQLADAAGGAVLWSERYDRPVEDLFTLRDDLTESVINVLASGDGKLAMIGRSALRRKSPASLQAYDYYLLGGELCNRSTRESIGEASLLLRRAVELDPELARGWVQLAYVYATEACNCFGPDLDASIANWRAAIEEAVRLDPIDAMAQMCLGDLRIALGDFAGAEEAHRKALETGHSQADVLALLAGARTMVAGDPMESQPLIERALRLNPLAPPWYFGMKGRIGFIHGRHAESIAALRHSPPDSPSTLLFRAMAHAAQGEMGPAEAAVGRLSREFSDFTAEGFIAGYPVAQPMAAEAIRKGARRAGAP